MKHEYAHSTMHAIRAARFKTSLSGITLEPNVITSHLDRVRPSATIRRGLGHLHTY